MLTARARRAAPVGVALTLYKVAAQEKRPLLFGARQWCHAPVLNSRTAGLFARVRTCERATALALCGEEAQHARFSRARAAPRGLELILRRQKAAALVAGPPRSVQGRGATRRPCPRARPTCARERPPLFFCYFKYGQRVRREIFAS